MKVVWSKRATRKMLATADYIAQEFGVSYATSFVQEALSITQLLEEHPELGQVELSLLHKKEEFRHLVVGKKNKVIYCIHNNEVWVADFWDVRRNPKELTKDL